MNYKLLIPNIQINFIWYKSMTIINFICSNNKKNSPFFCSISKETLAFAFFLVIIFVWWSLIFAHKFSLVIRKSSYFYFSISILSTQLIYFANYNNKKNERFFSSRNQQENYLVIHLRKKILQKWLHNHCHFR